MGRMGGDQSVSGGARLAGVAALLGLAPLLAACAGGEIETGSVESRPLAPIGAQATPPAVSQAQLTVIAAYRSVCLGTSFDQTGVDRALFELGYKPSGEDEAGRRRFAKGKARVEVSAPGEAAGVGSGQAYCGVTFAGLRSGAAQEALQEALRGSGAPYSPRDLTAMETDETRATVDGSDYYAVASVIDGGFGASGLALTKAPKAPERAPR